MQHDLDIADQSGASFRSDLNNALKALASTSLGTGRPTGVQQGQFWLDSDTPSSTVWTLNLYDGTGDIALFQIDITNDTYTPAPIATQAVTVSTGTLDIGAKYAPLLTCSSTSGVTSLGTAAANTIRTVWHTAALTYTHNATSLICPGGVNLTTASGDFVVWLSLGSGNWRCMGGYKASGRPFVASGTPTVTLRTSGSGTHTPAGSTRWMRVRMWGGGGAGGGAPSTGAGQASAGGGGGAGGYVEHVYAAPSGSYSWAVGAGGSGASGADGGNGGNTTFGSLTASGGSGGIAGSTGTNSSAQGGAGGAASGGNVANFRGAPGGMSINSQTASIQLFGHGGGVGGGLGPAINNSGNGGNTNSGGGGSGLGNGSSQSARTGAGGGSGLIIIEEYT